MAVRRRHYFDSSALMRFLLRERDGHEAASEAWLRSGDVATVRVTYAETRAALAGVRRNRQLTARRYARLKTIWESMWPDIQMIDVDQALVGQAARLAERYPLRGYDAIPLAAARNSGCDVLVSADNALSVAARRLRITVLDLNSRN